MLPIGSRLRQARRCNEQLSLRGLASTHPELFQKDLDLVTKVTGSEVKRVCHATNGDTTCPYPIMPGAIRIAA